MSSLSSALLREPLIQFLLLGLLIFGADQWATASRTDPHHIRVDDDQYQQLAQIFTEGQGREPSPSEMKNLIIKWAENEILYREALTMELDQGDEMIRSRMILKLRDILFNNAIVENPTDGELEEFFEFNRAQYDVPERFDIEQFGADDLADLTAAQALAQQLGTSEPVPEAYQQSLRSYQQRPASNLGTLFGAEMQQQLLQAPEGQWLALQQGQRLRLVRITQRHPAEAVELSTVKSAVTRDWKKFRYDIQLADQTKAIADRYSIEMDLSPALAEKVSVTVSNDEIRRTPSTAGPAPRAAMN